MPLPATVPDCILVRHAHAEWPAYLGRDFDRPLTPRGLDDARETGRALRDAGILPSRIIASSARRTAQTARILIEQLGLPTGSLQLLKSLYNAEASVLRDALDAAADGGGPVLLVAHNPGISELARRLSGNETSPSLRPAEWKVFRDPTADFTVDRQTGR